MRKTCGRLVYKLWVLTGQFIAGLRTTFVIFDFGGKAAVCTRFVQKLYPGFYHPVYNNSYLLCGVFSTQSTQPIKTTTMYIKEY